MFMLCYGNGIPLLLPSLPVNMLHYRKLIATYYLSPILVIFKGLLNYEGNFDYISF